MFYRGAKTIALLFTLIHVLCLPLSSSYDGMEYVHLANILGTHAFSGDWNFLRTPLFPLALKAVFAMGGEQPQAAMLVSTSFGLAGALLVASTVRYAAGGVAGGCALLAIVLYPALITYQHMILSETGIFFFLALIVALTIRSQQRPVAAAIGLALAIAAGYYWRPTLLYISPVIAAAYALVAGRRRWASVVLLAPWLLAYPWIHLTAAHGADNSETVASGMYKQVLVPPDDPMFGDLGSQYQHILREEVGPRRFPLDGLSIVGEGRHDWLKQLSQMYIRAGLLHLIAGHPGRYALGVTRSFLYFLGVPHHRVDDENWSFAQMVFQEWPKAQTFENVPYWIPQYNAQFQPQHYTGGALLDRMLLRLLSLYTPLVLIASAVSLLWMFVALRQREATAIALTAIPISFIALHALTLMSAARYAFPIYPLTIGNLIVLISLAYRGWMAKRSSL